MNEEETEITYFIPKVFEKFDSHSLWKKNDSAHKSKPWRSGSNPTSG